MKIERIKYGELENNCYIIYSDAPESGDGTCGECWILDPGGAAERIISFVRDHSLTPKGILITHHHDDHTAAAPRVAREFGIPVYIHEAEADLPDVRSLRAETVSMKDGDVLTVGEPGAGGAEIKVVSTPGHSKGSVCFLCEAENLAFTGDCVFSDETGYTIFEGGSKHEMIDSIGSIINKWPDDLVIYPGHFEPADMGYVKANNIDYLKAMKRYRQKNGEK